MPLAVTVIIAAKDAADTIERAVRSALAQPEAAEIMVVDDGSSDDTGARAAALDAGAGRVKAIRFDKNQGPAEARNAALAASSAPLFCVLDADDYMLPGRLAGLLAQWRDDDVMLADDLLIADESAPEAITGKLLEQEAPGPALDLPAFVAGNRSRKGAERREIGFLKPLTSRAFFDVHGLRYDPGLRLAEDFILYAQALVAGARFRIVPACGYVAVRRANSLSGNHRTADLGAQCAAEAAIAALPGLSEASRKAMLGRAAETRRKWDFRRAIDARHARGVAGGVLQMLSTPTSIPFMIRQGLKDRAAR